MRQRKALSLATSFTLLTLLLEACTFKVEVLSTPTASALPVPSASAMFTELQPTSTELPPTAIPPTQTPARIPIRATTLAGLGMVNSFQTADIVRSLAFTPDGTVLAAGIGNFEAFEIGLWDIPSGQSLGPLTGHTDIIWDAAFSPDGQMLATVSNDKTARIWDWRNKTLLKSLDFPGPAVRVRFSPDGQVLAVGGVDEQQNQIQYAAVWTYSVGVWQPLIKFPEYMDITALAYSPKGGVLVGGGTSRNLQVWNSSDGSRLFTLNHAHQVFDIAVSPNGSVLAAATCENVEYPECADGGVWLWDLPSGKLMKKLAGFPDFVDHVEFTADGSCLIAASADGTLRFYSMSDYTPLKELKLAGGISALGLSPDGGQLATGDIQGTVQLWNIVSEP